jgi:hypothetical protein
LLGIARTLTGMSGDAPPQVAETSLSEQLPEFFQLYRWRIVTREPRSVLELCDDRIECRVLVVRRTELAQVKMGFFEQPLCKRRGHTGFANPGLARDHHDLTAYFLCAFPSTQ